MPFLVGLDNYYPDFSHWYVNQVLANIDSSRSIVLLAKANHQVVGVALGKRDDLEVKLRCVRIHEGLKNTGLGIRLLDRMLEELAFEKPHCTVSEELIHQYSRIFVKRYGFVLTDVSKGRYRPNKLEYCFN